MEKPSERPEFVGWSANGGWTLSVDEWVDMNTSPSEPTGWGANRRWTFDIHGQVDMNAGWSEGEEMDMGTGWPRDGKVDMNAGSPGGGGVDMNTESPEGEEVDMNTGSSEDEGVDMDTCSFEVGSPGLGAISQHHGSNVPTSVSGVDSLCNGYDIELTMPTPASGSQDNATPVEHPLPSAAMSEFVLDELFASPAYLDPALNQQLLHPLLYQQIPPTLPNRLFYYAQQGYVAPLVEDRSFDTAGAEARRLLHQAEKLGHHPFTLLQYNPMALPRAPLPVKVGGNVVWIVGSNEDETPSPEGNAEIKTSRKAGLSIPVEVGPILFPTRETMECVVEGYKEIGVEVVSVVFLGPRVVVTLAAMPKVVLPAQVGQCQAVYLLQGQPLVGSGFEKLRAFQWKFATMLFYMPSGIAVGDEVSVMDRIQGKLQGVLVGVEWARWAEGGGEKWLVTGWCYFGNDMEGPKEDALENGRGYVVVNRANTPVGVFGYVF